MASTTARASRRSPCPASAGCGGVRFRIDPSGRTCTSSRCGSHAKPIFSMTCAASTSARTTPIAVARVRPRPPRRAGVRRPAGRPWRGRSRAYRRRRIRRHAGTARCCRCARAGPPRARWRSRRRGRRASWRRRPRAPRTRRCRASRRPHRRRGGPRAAPPAASVGSTAGVVHTRSRSRRTRRSPPRTAGIARRERAGWSTRPAKSRRRRAAPRPSRRGERPRCRSRRRSGQRLKGPHGRRPAWGLSFAPFVPKTIPAVARLIRAVMPEFGASGPGFAINDPEVDDMFTAYSAPALDVLRSRLRER